MADDGAACGKNVGEGEGGGGGGERGQKMKKLFF